MPNAKRLMVFIFMVLMTGAHVLMKVLAFSLILRLSQVWLMCYMAGDLGIYFLIKMFRGDLRYWVNTSGFLGLLLTFLPRVMVKVITDL